MNKTLFGLCAEIEGVESIVTGLAVQFDEERERLAPKSMRSALFGLADYLHRIAEDLADMDREGGVA